MQSAKQWGLRRALSRAMVLGAIVSAVGSVGCGSVEPVEPAAAPVTDPTRLYMSLEFDHPAVTMDTAAPYNTLQLTAMPLDASGNSMTGLPTPVYTSSDTTQVTVSPTGLITALAPTATPVEVTAKLVVGPVTHTDVARINVTTLSSPPPVLASLSIDPVPPDSAVWSPFFDDGYEYNGIFYSSPFVLVTFVDPPIVTQVIGVRPVVLDAANNAIPQTLIAYKSLDPKVATIEKFADARRGVTLIQPGSVRIVARTTMYGVTRADTASFTVTRPVFRTVQVHPGPGGTPIFGQSDITIPPYGIVVFSNTINDTVDVVFDSPTPMTDLPTRVCDRLAQQIEFQIFEPSSSCGRGDALLLPIPQYDGWDFFTTSVQVRQFTTPGVYTYHSTRLGATGRIVVDAGP